jgi:hypothetical protein
MGDGEAVQQCTFVSAAVYISNRLLALAEVGMRRRSEDVTWMHVTRVMLSMKYLPAST